MSTVTINTQITGQPDAEDRETWRFFVTTENTRRAQVNEQIQVLNASTNTNNPLLPILPSGPGELRSSFESILSEMTRRGYKELRETYEQSEASNESFRELRQFWAQQKDPAKRASMIAAFKAAGA